VAACQTVPPAQIKILGARVRLSFATSETELVCFFSLEPLAVILPGGQSAGRRECESGGEG